MGMFDNLLNRAEKERSDEERRRQNLGGMSEGQRLGYYAVSGGADAGQGFGRAIGTMAGADMRSQGERDQDRVRAVQDAAKGLDTSDPDYLLKISKVLQENGMIEEAKNAQTAYENLVLKRQDQGIKDQESKRKAAADADNATIRKMNADTNAKKLGMMGPKLVQYGNALDGIAEQLATMDPTDPRYAQLTIRGDGLLQAMANESRGQFKYVNAGDRVYVQDAQGNTVKELAVGAKPGSQLATDKQNQKTADAAKEAESAYKATKAQLQATYDKVLALYNHPGLDKFVGPVIGAAAQTTPEKSGFMGNVASAAARGKDGEAAYAIYQSVQGGTLINALIDLKEKSKTGASGLGALSEVEGSKLQAAKASLNTQQDPAAFRANLKVYADTLADTGKRLDEKATEYRITPTPLNAGQFTGPQRRVAAPKPAAAPAAPAGGAGWSAKRL